MKKMQMHKWNETSLQTDCAELWVITQSLKIVVVLLAVMLCCSHTHIHTHTQWGEAVCDGIYNDEAVCLVSHIKSLLTQCLLWLINRKPQGGWRRGDEDEEEEDELRSQSQKKLWWYKGRTGREQHVTEGLASSSHRHTHTHTYTK